MIEQTFYKGYEIRRHTFQCGGERRLLGYSVRKTLADGTVVPYRRKSKNRAATFSDTHFESEEDAKRAIDAGEIKVNKPKRRKGDPNPSPRSDCHTPLTTPPRGCKIANRRKQA